MIKDDLVIKSCHEYEQVIEKSRFICSISRAENESAANAFISEIKKKYYDATHNCSAYIIGRERMLQKSSDDGEPSGTAGIPMLEVMRKTGLTDTVAVVTRYFGGKKLGAGGLIRAYSSTVSGAIKETGVVIRKKMQKTRLEFDYNMIGLLDNKLSGYKIINKEFQENVVYDIYVDLEEKDSVKAYLIDLTHAKIAVTFLNTVLCEFPYEKKEPL